MFSQMSGKYRKTLSFVHMNFPSVPKKRTQSESFANEIKKQGLIDVSGSWLTTGVALLLYLNEASLLQPKKQLDVIGVLPLEKRRLAE